MEIANHGGSSENTLCLSSQLGLLFTVYLFVVAFMEINLVITRKSYLYFFFFFSRS